MSTQPTTKLTPPLKTRFCKGKAISITGKTYKSYKALAAAYGVKQKTLYTRVASGRTGKDLVAPKRSRQFPGVIIADKKYESLTDLAAAYGLPRSLVGNRYWLGIRGEALVAPHQRKPNMRIKPNIGGITYSTLAAATRAVGVVPYGAVRNRTSALGWTPEEALLTPLGQRPPRLTRVEQRQE